MTTPTTMEIAWAATRSRRRPDLRLVSMAVAMVWEYSVSPSAQTACENVAVFDGKRRSHTSRRKPATLRQGPQQLPGNVALRFGSSLARRRFAILKNFIWPAESVAAGTPGSMGPPRHPLLVSQEVCLPRLHDPGQRQWHMQDGRSCDPEPGG